MVSITCIGGDGDVDCNKVLSADVNCPGLDPCLGGQACNGTACTGVGQTCNVDTCSPVACPPPPNTDCWVQGQCLPSSFPDCAANDQLPEDTPCQVGGGPNRACDAAGECVLAGGACDTPADCPTPTDPCLAATCVSNVCGSGPGPNGVSCTNDVGGPGTCQAGACECTSDVCTCETNGDCLGGGECTEIACNATAGTCGAPVDADNCIPCSTGVCFAGTCDTPITYTDDFDLTRAQFRAYNNLLPADPLCAIPNLFPGADNEKCIEVNAFPPSEDISGSMNFTSTGTDAWDVAVVQNLDFVIDAFIPAAGSQVLIITSSQTLLDGAGAGTIADVTQGGGVGLAPLANPAFNMAVQDCRPDPSVCPPTVPPTDPLTPGCTCGGTVSCKATNTVGAGLSCGVDSDCILFASLGQTCGLLVPGECDPVDTSESICGLAALGPGNGALCKIWPDDVADFADSGCLNGLPNPLDNFERFFEPIVFISGATAGGLGLAPPPTSANECVQLGFALGNGPNAVDGWYVANPYLQDASQFTALSGVQQP